MTTTTQVLSANNGMIADSQLTRLYHSLCNARMLVALMLLALQALAWSGWGTQTHVSSLWLPSATLLLYLGVVIWQRFLIAPPKQAQQKFGLTWFLYCGIDIVMIVLLQSLPQTLSVNYLTLLALPALGAAILSRLRLALATAAVIALLLLAEAGNWSFDLHGEVSNRYVQAGLIGGAYFLVVLLVHQITTRLQKEELSAQQHEAQTALESTVNRLVMEHLGHGVMVVQADGWIRAANPNAQTWLALDGDAVLQRSLRLDQAPTQLLWALASRSFETQASHEASVSLPVLGEGSTMRHLLVQSHVTTVPRLGAQPVCVLFLEDQREVEAKIRTEKMAAMGRMSTAMAHEIRNPLAAIANANQLLQEVLQDPGNQKLAHIIAQNAQRLDKIVKDVLSVAHTERGRQEFDHALSKQATPAALLGLNHALHAIAHDWLAQHADFAAAHVLALKLTSEELKVLFDYDHLRQILINLLDNAARHVLPEQGTHGPAMVIQSAQDLLGVQVSVWNAGAALDPSVQAHLFEPFFSSQARSSGLGLYISQELCAQHDAVLRYSRLAYDDQQGNCFTIHFSP